MAIIKTGPASDHRHKDSRGLWTVGETKSNTVPNHTHTVDLAGYAAKSESDALYATKAALDAALDRITVLEGTSSPPSIPGPEPPSGLTGPERNWVDLQSKIDAAPLGSVVVPDPGIYRGMITHGRATTLGGSGWEIRGSDIWAEWSGTGPWMSGRTIPAFEAQPDRYSALPHQVFVDGVRQTQIPLGVSPAVGQFSVDITRRVLLGTNPAGKRVEVAVRERIIWVTASGARIDAQAAIRHSMSPTQAGALQVSGYGAGRVDGFYLGGGFGIFDAQGALLSLQGGGSDHLIEDFDFRRGGHLGLHLPGVGSWAAGSPSTLTLQSKNWTIRRGKAGECNWGQWDLGWECGNLKSTFVDYLTIEDVESWGIPGTVFDGGRGIWTDTGTRNLAVRRIRQHGTARGMFFESTRQGLIEECVVYDLPTDGGWFSSVGEAGIICASSGDMTVQRNLIVRCAAGVGAVGQARDDDPLHFNIRLANNTVISPRGVGAGFDGDAIGATNGASGNSYWDTKRWRWGGVEYETVADWNARSEVSSERMMTVAERDAVLMAAGVPG